MDGWSGKDKRSSSGDEAEKVYLEMESSGSSDKSQRPLESSVMKHVIGAACMLTQKSSDEDVDDEERISTFDVYIVNENGKVNGYELKHIGPADGIESMSSPGDSSADEVIRSFRFDRKGRGVPPHEFYKRKRSHELPQNHGGSSSCGNKEKCEPIILEISEISETYNGNDTDEHQDSGKGSQSSAVLEKTSSCQSNEMPSSFINVGNDLTGQEVSKESDIEVSKGNEDTKEESLLALPDKSASSGPTLLSSSSELSVSRELETASSTSALAEPKKKEDREMNDSRAMGNIIKAIQAQEPEEKDIINQKIGLNSPCETAEQTYTSEDIVNSEDLCKELKTALLAAFIPSMEPSSAEASETSFVETCITRNIGDRLVDGMEKVEEFKSILDFDRTDNPATCSDSRGREADRDDEMIVFVEAGDVGRKKSNTHTRNNRVGRLVKFFENLEERSKEESRS
ncbi:putative protein with Ca-binding domain [Encephalitozoon cuniculi GB-M1]|uniref:Uncharacterized protein n=1 Tax=Encephalitozoon cuniculi (strain GB-M1) TaxID=284813 RepID=Q8SUB5_ENCCU|nr:uncharacterized protein ECU10_1500 [Encephalitozoon cuniculi GB-M1]CAD25869.1 putative protein with Ca-binding domain [Encephalitozoon cuniculi GB-M1]